MEIEQYQIVLVNLNLTLGNETKKTRPCVVISPNEMNRNLNTITIAPMTTTIKKYPSRVLVKHNGKKGTVVLDQIRTIDRQRVVKSLGAISDNEIQEIKLVIREMFVD